MSQFLNTKAESGQKDMEQGCYNHGWHSSLGLRFPGLVWMGSGLSVASQTIPHETHNLWKNHAWCTYRFKRSTAPPHFLFTQIAMLALLPCSTRGRHCSIIKVGCEHGLALSTPLLPPEAAAALIWTTGPGKRWGYKYLFTVISRHIYFLFLPALLLQRMTF